MSRRRLLHPPLPAPARCHWLWRSRADGPRGDRSRLCRSARRYRRPARPARCRCSRPARRASSSSTWTAGRRRSTRSTPSRGSTAENGQPFKMAIEPTQFNNVGNTLGSPVEVPAVRRERPAGQRPVPARRDSAPTTWRRPLDDVASSPSTPTPTTSCTPATACRAGPAWGRGSATAWAASARTCRASSSSTAG